jgi:PsbP-like protein
MHLATNDFILSFRISIAGTVISLFLLASILQPLDLIQGEAIAQQQSQQEPGRKISVGAAASNNFTNYTNPTYGFSLLYPSEWINEEINPGVNLTFLISFNPPPTEFGESIFVYMAIKNLTDKNASLKDFAEAEINFLNSPPSATSPTADASARTILESEPDYIAGNTQAHKVVYSEKVSGTISRIMEIYFVNGNMGYILSFIADATTYDKYLPTFQKMADSVKLTTIANQ